MAQIPIDQVHKQQIHAGTIGRNKGHKFEELLTNEINTLNIHSLALNTLNEHVYTGNPAILLLDYIATKENVIIKSVQAWWLGGLATSGNGDQLLDEEGNVITKSKSDIIVEITTTDNKTFRKGISVKTCSKKTPTNDQMFFTTAKAFCRLLQDNGITISPEAVNALCMFCGDIDFRPIDILSPEELSKRISDPSRFFWEELDSTLQTEWENIFTKHQNKITKILFQKAYKDDPYAPDYLLHQTNKYENLNECKVALFTIDEIVTFSKKHSGFMLSPYIIRKGSFKHDNSTHYAPRFGFIQFQRGGQKQHPTQLQFNLKAGYFNHL